VLSSNAVLNKINPSQSLQLIGAVNLVAGLAGNVSWSVDSSSGLDLASVALSPLSQSISQSSTATSQARQIYFVVPANALQGGLNYKFTLSVQVASLAMSSSTSLTILTNAAPLPGSFLVTPTAGEEVVDLFVFGCTQWQDDDLPISYQFSYRSVSGNAVIMKSVSQATFASFALPAGAAENAYQVTCLADILDHLNAYTTQSVNVQVTTSNRLTANLTQELLNTTLAALTTSTNPDTIKQAAALTSYLLNKVNCSLAPNCTQLHRKACYRTEQTCGACLSNDLIGIAGDANTACYTATEYVHHYAHLIGGSKAKQHPHNIDHNKLQLRTQANANANANANTNTGSSVASIDFLMSDEEFLLQTLDYHQNNHNNEFGTTMQ
jgi:hypothetical protein